MKYTLLSSALSLFLTGTALANPNPIISRGKTVYTSNGNASYLNDNKFGGATFNVSANSWIALNVGSGHSKVFFTWNNPNYTWSDVIASSTSCKQNLNTVEDYTIQKSSNSTNGFDGQWSTLATVTGNIVTARGHDVDMAGATWIRMNISKGAGTLDEIEVFDITSTSTDKWFFVGTSISANTYKATPPTKNFADLITQAHSTFTPAMVRGGIPCINSTDFANEVSKYLAVTNNVTYWAIEMGTNDAWGGTNGGVATFKTNMQNVITACKNAGVKPILARVIGTNKTAATWQVHPDYLKAIDDLTSQNNLIAGPDLYTYFTTHTSELNSDGVHPNASGAASIQRLWAEKINSLFVVTELETESTMKNELKIYPNPALNGQFTMEQPFESSQLELYDVKGSLLFQKTIDGNIVSLSTSLPKGMYVLKVKAQQKSLVQTVVVE